MLKHHRFKPCHDFCRLLRMTSGSDAEIDFGCADAQLLEEDVGHIEVVMLTGMHNHLLDPRNLLQRAMNWGQLHEIRPRTDDMN